MVFLDEPMEERVRIIDDLGFAVEIWDWTTKDLDALAATGALFTSMTGYVEGNLTEPEGAEALLRTAQQSIVASAALGTPNLNLHGTGLDSRGLPVQPRDEVTEAMWTRAQETLARIAELGRHEGVVFCLENLNTAVDHPGTPFARAADTRALVRAVDSPHLRMNLDLYHAQIGEGNLIQLIRDSIAHIGEIQVADVPGRCEPGTGEINYTAIARSLHDVGYDGVVGLEAWAAGDSPTALQRFREAFTDRG
jgi:hydroxypyruvate isomerase